MIEIGVGSEMLHWSRHFGLDWRGSFSFVVRHVLGVDVGTG